MEDKLILTQNDFSLNKIINQTFQTTQRIKLKCFDVSKNYVIFGASSGGIYIFDLKPCQFRKLIPSKGGTAELISISPNEKNVAIVNLKGLVIVLENCFVDSNCQYQIYSEHEGHTVTCMKWYNNDLYCGDSSGKVSVVLSLNLLTKAIFHTPTASILQLDSEIIQIDCFSTYILVSTRTRSVLCDTEKEVFKPIGKRVRDGPFGACFLSLPANLKNKNHTENNIPHTCDNKPSSSSNASSMKIYCARPGARLWEADFDASVISTHQFRTALTGKKQTEIVVISSQDDKSNVSFIQSCSLEELSESFNFARLHIIRNQFLLTFNKTGFYIIDPLAGHLIFWNNSYENIRDVKMLNSSLYIWHNKEIIKLSIVTLEELVLESLFQREYIIATQLCLKYSEDILQLINKPSRIHLIGVLKTKLLELGETDLLKEMLPLLEHVKNRKDINILKYRDGKNVKIIENIHSLEDETEDYREFDINIPDNLLNLKSISLVSERINEGTRSIKKKFQVFETKVKTLATDTLQKVYRDEYTEPLKVNKVVSGSVQSASNEAAKVNNVNSYDFQATAKIEDQENLQTNDTEYDDVTYQLKILLEQYRVNKIHKNIETSRVTRLLERMNSDSLRDLFTVFITHVKELNGEDVSLWCKGQYLKYFARTKQHKDLTISDTELIDYLLNCFIEVNSMTCLGCKCGYPLPKSKDCKPFYIEIGLSLVEITGDIVKLNHHVPYMWKYYLSKLTDNEILNKIALIIQYNNIKLIESHLKNATYDTWDESVKLFVKLKNKVCLNCGSKINIDGLISWTDFGLILLKSLGGTNTIKLLQFYSRYIGKGELNSTFYQACIFATSIGGLENKFQQKPCELFDKFCSKPVRIELQKCLE